MFHPKNSARPPLGFHAAIPALHLGSSLANSPHSELLEMDGKISGNLVKGFAMPCHGERLTGLQTKFQGGMIMMDAGEFAGRVAVVTGGSEGLGLDFCRVLCEADCEVYFCSRNAQKGALAAKALGRRAHYYQADLVAPDQIKAFAAYVR